MVDNNWVKLSKLSIHQKADRFKTSHIGKDFESEALQLIAGYIDVYSLGPGEVIFQQGDKSSYLCIGCSGRINIIKTDSDGIEKIIATIGPGQPFGEMSLFDNEPRSASAVASTTVEMMVLNAPSFDLLFEKYPRMWGKLVYPIVKSVNKRLRQTSCLLADYLKY